jgi:hypothetical protein
MKKYFGGEKARTGMYLNSKTGEFVDLLKSGDILPGTGLTRFFRVPRWLPFIAGPFFGLFFVVFLPLTGIIALASVAVIKTRFMQSLLRSGQRRPAMLK